MFSRQAFTGKGEWWSVIAASSEGIDMHYCYYLCYSILIYN